MLPQRQLYDNSAASQLKTASTVFSYIQEIKLGAHAFRLNIDFNQSYMYELRIHPHHINVVRLIVSKVTINFKMTTFLGTARVNLLPFPLIFRLLQ